jgi:hypothetical protein
MNSPKFIVSLLPNEIFVFGSNLEGRHGRGAAKQALQWGAVYGRGVGIAGKTYAIPTRKFLPGQVQTIGTPYFDGHRSLVTMPLSDIHSYVTDFIRYAATHKELTFLVTEIGCNNAGYTPAQMAGVFGEAKIYNNIFLPERFNKVLDI